MTDLKPCPFCGQMQENKNTENIKNTDTSVITCSWCLAEVDAVQWNERPIEDQLRAENTRLRAALEAIAKAGEKGNYDIDGRMNWHGMNDPSEFAREALEEK